MRKFKLIFIIALVITLTTAVAIGAEDIVAEEDGEFDFSKYQEELEEMGILTTDRVEELKDEALLSFESGNFEEAEQKLEEWANASNILSNIIAAGLEPFYGSLRSEREDFGMDKVSALISYESKVNNLRKDRNEAFVMRAEALKEIGRTEESMALFREVLGLIDLENWELWTRAANGLYEIINVPLIDLD